jgi:glycosyltransferase involved in cell wall biosynthesis
MKILIVSNFYYNRGGDCTYMFSLKRLLEEKGHKVIVFSMHHPLNFDSPYSRYFVNYINYDQAVKKISISTGFEVLSRAVFSLEAMRKMERLIEDEQPDIAHLQNIHHHITPSIFYPLKRNKIPIVWTLHDFVLICPNTSFLANGRICERCKKRKYFWPPLVRCKKNSFLASLMAGIETTIHRLMRVNELVDVFIAPSEFLKNKLIEYGFDPERIVSLNNFSNIEISEDGVKEDDYYLYIGRISFEKGIRTLIDAALMADTGRLRIIGEGPLKEEMLAYVQDRDHRARIEFLGHKSHDEVIKFLKRARFLVLPSECYENFPYSIIEAFACGKPVIASRIGGIPEIVRNWQTGLLFPPGDVENLSLKIRFFMKHPNKARTMGRDAREFIKNQLNGDVYYERLIKIYEELLKNKDEDFAN